MLSITYIGKSLFVLETVFKTSFKFIKLNITYVSISHKILIHYIALFLISPIFFSLQAQHIVS